MQILIVAGVVVACIILYVGTMYLNDRVEVPESCKQAYLEAQSCESCNRKGSSCNIQDTLKFIKEVKL